MAAILDLYSDLVRVQGLVPENDDTLNDAVDTLRQSIGSNEVSDLLLKKYYAGSAYGIYSLSEKVRSIVDDIKTFANRQNDTNGISNSSKIKIMLLLILMVIY